MTATTTRKERRYTQQRSSNTDIGWNNISTKYINTIYEDRQIHAQRCQKLRKGTRALCAKLVQWFWINRIFNEDSGQISIRKVRISHFGSRWTNKVKTTDSHTIDTA